MCGHTGSSIVGRLLTVAGLLSVWSVWACSVPVFRYALERWPPDFYEAYVFHRGPLTAAEQALVRELGPEGEAGRVSANVRPIPVDLAASPPRELVELWSQQPPVPLPALVLRYPAALGLRRTVWAGPLNAEAVRAVLDSPVRREIGRRIVGGDSAVWVLLESGEAGHDEAAARVLETRLEHLQKTLKLPVIEQADVEAGLVSVPQEQLKLSFSVLRCARQTAAEHVFARMLLGSEEDLDDLKEPMAFPIFGRGRVLFALVGKGINAETIDEACTFLTGPCSCTVKELNPGTDLLMAVDWNGLVRPIPPAESSLPAGSGLISAGAAPAAAPPGPGTEAAPTPTMMVRRVRGILISLGIGALAVLVLLGGSLLWSRHRE